MLRRHYLCHLVFTGAVLAIVTLTSCGSDSTGPGQEATAKSYFGVLAVAGSENLGGIFQVSTTVPTANAPEPVSGVLITNGGDAITLSGTVSGSAMSLSGSGYSIAAVVGSRGRVSGSGSAPGGLSASVSAPPDPLYGPPSSNPTGTYTGSFSATTTLKHRNTNALGQVVASCNVPILLTGTLTLHLSGKPDQLASHVDIRWNEASQSAGTCPPAYSYSHTDYYGIDFEGTSQSLVAMRVVAGVGSSGGQVTRPATFAGAVSGNTVVGTVYLGYHFTVPVTGATHFEWFPVTSAQVTLSRQ